MNSQGILVLCQSDEKDIVSGLLSEYFGEVKVFVFSDKNQALITLANDDNQQPRQITLVVLLSSVFGPVIEKKSLQTLCCLDRGRLVVVPDYSGQSIPRLWSNFIPPQYRNAQIGKVDRYQALPLPAFNLKAGQVNWRTVFFVAREFCLGHS